MDRKLTRFHLPERGSQLHEVDVHEAGASWNNKCKAIMACEGAKVILESVQSMHDSQKQVVVLAVVGEGSFVMVGKGATGVEVKSMRRPVNPLVQFTCESRIFSVIHGKRMITYAVGPVSVRLAAFRRRWQSLITKRATAVQKVQEIHESCGEN